MEVQLQVPQGQTCQITIRRPAIRNGSPYRAEASVMLDGRRLVAYSTGATVLEAANEAANRLDGQVRRTRERVLVPRDWFAWALGACRAWTWQGDTLVRHFRFRDFDDGMRFLEEIGRRAEDHKRHPDMSISSNLVTLKIANPHHAGITMAELRLAAKVNAVIDELQLGRNGIRPN